MNHSFIRQYLWSPAAMVFCIIALGGCDQSDKSISFPKPNDLVRVNADGSPYRGSGNFASEPWHCVHDNRTGLTWEVKTAQAGLHHKDHTYSWHEPEQRVHGDDPGPADAGKCSESRCDTSGFVLAVNEAGLCGFNDWRMPEHMELGSISDPRIKPPGPTIYGDYFPLTHAEEYWTRSDYGFYPEGAWAWNFYYGHDRVDRKETPKYVRLVRGEVTLRTEN